MSTKEDIKNFEALEKNDFSNDTNKVLLKSISILDNIMQKHYIEKVSPDFTKFLLMDVKLKPALTNNRILWILSLIFIPIILISIAIIYLNTGIVEKPVLINQILDKFYIAFQFINEPKVQQLFLIGEGIILLIIIEKIVSSYKIYRYSS